MRGASTSHPLRAAIGSASAALALWALPAGAQVLEMATPEVAAERMAKCGLGPVAISYDPVLESHVLTPAKADAASDDQLACIDKAAGHHDVALPPAVQARFDAMQEARWAAVFRSEARAWLSARGMLERVPEYVPGTTDDTAFARKVEVLCGPRAQGALQSEHGPHVLSPDWIRKGVPPTPEDTEAFGCVLNVIAVAGFKVAFVGNEAFVASD
jgi:hypothetical protein